MTLPLASERRQVQQQGAIQPVFRKCIFIFCWFEVYAVPMATDAVAFVCLCNSAPSDSDAWQLGDRWAVSVVEADTSVRLRTKRAL